MKCHIITGNADLLTALAAFKNFFGLSYEWLEYADSQQIKPREGDILIVTNDRPEQLDGIRTLHKIRSAPHLSAVPILFLSPTLSEHAQILFDEFALIWTSDLPFQSDQFFKTLGDIDVYQKQNENLLATITNIHEAIAAKEYKQAFNALKSIDRDYPHQFRRCLLYGRLFMEAKRFDDALKAANKALEIAEESLEAHNLLASIYYKMGNTEDYQKTLESTTKLAEIHLQNLIHWGDLYLEQGKSQRSITAFEAALEKDPENQKAKHGLLAAQLIEGRSSIQESHAFADNQSLEIARMFNLKGIAMAESGNFPAAERLYKNALKVLRHENLAHKLWLNLGLCMKKKGNLKRAHEYFTKSHEQAPPEYSRARLQMESLQVEIEAEQSGASNFAAKLRRTKGGETLNYMSLSHNSKKLKRSS